MKAVSSSGYGQPARKTAKKAGAGQGKDAEEEKKSPSSPTTSPKGGSSTTPFKYKKDIGKAGAKEKSKSTEKGPIKKKLDIGKKAVPGDVVAI